MGVPGREAQSSVLAQAAALEAQTVLTSRLAASESVRPKPREFVGPLRQTDAELTQRPLVDDLLKSDDEVKTGNCAGLYRVI